MTKYPIPTLFSLLFCLSANIHAEMYYWKNADGSLMATDQPPPAGTEFRTGQDLGPVNNLQQHASSENTTDAKNITDAVNKSEQNASAQHQPAENELAIVKLSPNAPPQEIKPATAADTTKTDAKKTDTAKTAAISPVLSIGSVKATTDNSAKDVTPDTLKPDDEAGCQKLYGTNCDKVFNWREHGKQYCAKFKNDQCRNDQWLEKRFKPLTLAERHQRTLRNASKNNREVEEIRDYLQRKYTGVCAIDPDKAPRLCKNAAYDKQIQQSFQKLSSNDQAEIKHLQEVLKYSKDRSLIARSIDRLLSLLPLAAASHGL